MNRTTANTRALEVIARPGRVESERDELHRLRQTVKALQHEVAMYEWSQDQQIAMAARAFIIARRRMQGNYSQKHQAEHNKRVRELDAVVGD